MKDTKRFVWQLLAILVVAGMVLTACASPTPEVIRETVVVEKTVEVEKVVEVEGEPVEVEKVVEVTPTPLPGDVPLNPEVSGEVEMWHFWASPVRRNAVRRVIAMCEEKLPNIDVTDTVKPWGDIWTANIAAVAAGSGMPDVIVSDRPTVPKDAADGIYMSLQDYADRDGITRDMYYGWAWDQAIYEGEIYGLPHETDVSVLFWNKNLFAQAGLDPERPPETWQELWEYADALDKVNEDGSYDTIAFFPLWNRGVDIWQYNNDADMIADDGTPQINNPNMVETVEWIQSWVDRYGGWQELQNWNAQFGAPPNDNFMSGKLAMRVDIFGYNSQLEFYRPSTTLEDGSRPRTEWGIGLLPHDEDASTGTWSGGFSLSIPTGSPNAEAAWEFIKCATGPEAQASWARDTQAQPTNIVAAEDPILAAANPLWEVVDDALAVSTGGVYVSEYPNWTEQLNQRWELVWTGELTPEEALTQAQEAVMEEIGD
ncbi:MAG: ABC transporter substrate-binding protein [Anaerolineae bacterium]